MRLSKIRILFAFLLCIIMVAGISQTFRIPETEAFQYGFETPDTSWVDTTLAGLTLREKIGQLVQVRVSGEFLNVESPEFQNLIRTIDRDRIGGAVLFAGNVYESAVLLNEMQQKSRVPLLISADFERGAAFRIEGTTSFPWTMAVGATGSEEFAYQQGRITAQESRALGVHWIFAPVMDVNNNPKNPVINIRSFGEDPRLVARLGSAFIRGAKAGGVLTTAKHFPGHGDTAVDSHIGLAVVPSDMDRLTSIELVPFKSAINAGVDAIMTAHVAMPEITGNKEIPATLSPSILTGLLREQLQFKGLIVTDAMEMGGITNRYWCGLAAVRAVEAGADIVLLPVDATVAINEIERAVEMGNIPPERIDASVRRILLTKSSLGLDRNRLVPVDKIEEEIARPENQALAQKIADYSITAIKNKDGLLPVSPVEDPQIFSLALDSGLDTSPGSIFQSEMRNIYPSLRTEWANARISKEQIDRIARMAANSRLIICSTFARLSSGRDISALPEDQQTIIKKLIDTRKPLIWIAFGNPYVLERFPQIGTYLCTFSYSDVSQRAAAKAVSGEIAVSGKMPVSVPGHASVGEGLQIPKLEMILKPIPVGSDNSSSNTFNNTIEIISKLEDSGALNLNRIQVGYRGSLILNLGSSKNLQAAPVMWTSSSRFSTVLASMLAAESGSLLLKVPLQDYLPEFENTAAGTVPISDLLADLSGKTAADSGNVILNQSLIAEALSRATALPIDLLLRRQLFNQLEPNPEIQRIGDEGLYLISDVAAVAQALLNKGIYNHRRILKPGTIALFAGTGNKGQALGWMKPQKDDWTGRLFSPQAFGCMDAEGHLLWMEPGEDLFVALSATPNPSSDTPIDKIYESILESIVGEVRAQ
jgi:beta-N-acetylhexosaminidase